MTSQNLATTEFEGIKVVVTGAASGIGLAAASFMSARGAQVAGLDLRAEKVLSPILGVQADVTSDCSVRDAIETAAHALGGIDVVINNVAIGALGDVAANADDEWHLLWDVNVVSIARVTRAALPWLQRSKHAAIVNTCSAVAETGLPGRALYSATKGAVLALTRAMAADFISQPIRVNCVTPGVVETPWQARAICEAGDPERHRASLAAFQPIGRLVSADEVANAIAYLASPLAGATTGVVLPVDGGLHALRLQTQTQGDDGGLPQAAVSGQSSSSTNIL